MSNPLMSVYPPLSPVSMVARRGARFPFNQPGLRLTHLGRGAVWLALRALGLGPGSRLAMPAYHCGSEVEAARLAGIEVIFYRVDASLRVDEEDLARAAKEADATYLISFFGFPMPVPPPGTRVIEDAAHALFSSEGDVPMGSRGDAAIFCPRKSLGTPDGGGVLIRAGAEPEGHPPWKRTARSFASLGMGWAAQSRVGPLRGPAVKVFRKVSKAEAAVESGNLTETIIGEWDLEARDLDVAASKPSRLTSWIAHGVNGDKIRDRRRRNYLRLAEALPHATLDPFRTLQPGVAPLYYPVRVADRDEAMARLQAHGVRAIEIWPVPHPLLDRDRFAELEPLRHQMIALPVHQYLSEWHMDRLVNAARNAGL